MKAIEFILEIVGWLIIAFGTTAGAGLIALLIYIKWPHDIGKLVSIIISFLGFILGSLWATKIWKRYGTIEWLSRIRRIS